MTAVLSGFKPDIAFISASVSATVFISFINQAFPKPPLNGITSPSGFPIIYLVFNMLSIGNSPVILPEVCS